MKSEELLNTANCFLTFSRKQAIDTFSETCLKDFALWNFT